MKKIIALALVLILCLSIVACKNSNDDKGAETTTAETTAETTTAEETTTVVTEQYDPRDPAVDDIF